MSEKKNGGASPLREPPPQLQYFAFMSLAGAPPTGYLSESETKVGIIGVMCKG